MEAAGGPDAELVAAAAEMQAWQAFFDATQYALIIQADYQNMSSVVQGLLW